MRLKIFFPLLYFLIIPLFFWRKEFLWSKVLLFSFFNLLFLLTSFSQKSGKLPWSFLLWFLWIVLLSFSFLYAKDPYRTFLLFLVQFNLLVFLYLLTKEKADGFIFALFLCLSAIAVSGAGFLQKWGIFMKPFYTKYGEIDISSTFGLSNFSAEYIATASLFSFLLLKKEKWFYLLGIPSLFLTLLYILLSGALAALLGFLAGAGCYLFIIGGRKRWLIAGAGIVFLILIFFFPPLKKFGERLRNIVQMEDAPSLFRIECWKASMRIFLDHPFTGVGGGNFEVYVEKYGSARLEELSDPLNVKVKRPHNDFLQALSESGILSIPFLVFFFLPVFHSFKNKTHEYLPPLLSYIMISLFSFPIQSIPTSGAFFLAAHLAEEDGALKPPRSLHLFLSTLFLLLNLFILYSCWRLHNGEYLRKKAMVHFQKNELLDALSFINKAIKVNPFESDHYFLRGQILHRMRQIPQAVEDFKRFVIKNPYHGKAYYILSLLELSLGRFKDAEEHMDRAFEFKRIKDIPFYCYAYRIYSEAGNREKAEKVLPLCSQKGRTE